MQSRFRAGLAGLQALSGETGGVPRPRSLIRSGTIAKFSIQAGLTGAQLHLDVHLDALYGGTGGVPRTNIPFPAAPGVSKLFNFDTPGEEAR